MGPLRLRIAAKGMELSVQLSDFSVNGAGVLADRELPCLTEVSIETARPGRALPTELTATIRHATPRPDGQWVLGCSFTRLLTTLDVETLG